MLPFFSLFVSKIVLRFPESPQDFSRLFYFICIYDTLFDACEKGGKRRGMLRA